jgi:uncharacterized protein YmfQ (DUF2313 family)
MNEENYRDQLLSLLPPGKAITKEPTSGIGRMMHGLGIELERVEERAGDLIVESVPGNCDELLAEWETDFGLLPTGTTAERKAALAAKVIEVGQQYPSYFTDIITAYGFTSTISQFKPAWAGVMVAGDACGDWYMLFYWLVNVLDAGTTVDDMTAMMKEISRLKPGHTQVFFDYPGSTVAVPKFYLGSALSKDVMNAQVVCVNETSLYQESNVEWDINANVAYVRSTTVAVSLNEFIGHGFYVDGILFAITANGSAIVGADFSITVDKPFPYSTRGSAVAVSALPVAFETYFDKGVSGELEIIVGGIPGPVVEDEYAGSELIIHTGEDIVVCKDAGAGTYGTVGDYFLMGIIVDRYIAPGELIGATISGVCLDVSPFSFLITDNDESIDIGGGDLRVVVYIGESVASTIDDNGSTTTMPIITPKKYDITGNDFFGAGCFSFAFSEGFLRAGGYFLSGFSSGFKKH